MVAHATRTVRGCHQHAGARHETLGATPLGAGGCQAPRVAEGARRPRAPPSRRPAPDVVRRQRVPRARTGRHELNRSRQDLRSASVAERCPRGDEASGEDGAVPVPGICGCRGRVKEIGPAALQHPILRRPGADLEEKHEIHGGSPRPLTPASSIREERLRRVVQCPAPRRTSQW